jgi:diguanylate cyclase (GGDEF)-like protein/PAS domain S-box-containing protein
MVSIGERNSGGKPRLRGLPTGSPQSDRRGVETGAGQGLDAPVHPVGFDTADPDSEGFRVLADSSPVGIAHLDETGAVAYVNPRWREMTGGNLQGGGDPLEILHPDDRQRALAELDRHIREESSVPVECRLRSPKGRSRWVNLRVAPVYHDDSRHGHVVSIEDITDLVAARESTSKLAHIVESTTDLVAIIDFTTGELTYLNSAAKASLAYDGGPYPNVNQIYPAAEITRFSEEALPVLLRGDTWTGEMLTLSRGGGSLRIMHTVTPELDASGRLLRLSVLGRDVTDQRRAEADLAHKATHDTLTGLPNRALLGDRLAQALARAKRDRHPVAVMFVDLDGFKAVNDKHGHEAGDRVLVEVAKRLSVVLRPSDTVARLGGDEFVVVCEDMEGESDAMRVARRTLATIDSQPFDVPNGHVDVSASIGIALSSYPDVRAETLLRDADAAMYRAKEASGSKIELFDQVMRSRNNRRQELVQQLIDGMAGDQLEVHYQPIIDLSTGMIAGVEALVRWDHPERGMLAASDFLDIADEAGLMAKIDSHVLDKACAQLALWQDSEGAKTPRVHINLSYRHHARSGVFALVDQALRSSGADASGVALEFAEQELMADPASALSALGSLAERGVHIIVNDFGTETSSLDALSRFPIDTVKITRRFVESLDGDSPGVARALAGVAANLGFSAVGVGVETPGQLDGLLQLGCPYAQGNHFQSPTTAADVTAMLDRQFEVA